MLVIKKLKKLFRKPNQPLVKVLVFKTRLIENLKKFQLKYPNTAFAPVLKSNAYGHGLTEVAEILQKENIPFFVVDSLFEANVLKSQGIKKPVLIIGYSTLGQALSIRSKNIAVTIVSMGQLLELSKGLNKKTVCHIKIDTGMHRQGILPEDFTGAVELIKANKNIVLEGVCSHFADADSGNQDFSTKQIEIWQKAVGVFKENFSSIKYFHIANSAGVKYGADLQTNVVRLGIGLYGFDQSGEVSGLKPVLELRTIVSGIKNIKSGEFIGYNNTFQAKNEMKIATLPVGYFEGVDRRLSGKGFVKIKGQLCPILGRVSMNIISVDVSSVSDIQVGDEAVVISTEVEDKNSAQNIAKECGTIPYEILVHIPGHLRREIV